ncbi:MAG: PLP-dependent transferase [Terriglobales bacterium]
MQFETLAVHSGAERDETGAVAPPLHFSTNYEHNPDGVPARDFLYIRFGNPMERRLEGALSAVEGGAAALVFASGVAAGASYLESLPSGSHVLFSDDLFYGFRDLAPDFLPRWGIEWSYVDMTDLNAVRTELRPNTRVVWAETPTNPLMKIYDLTGLATLAHERGAQLLVDSTFPTPALLRPLTLAADITLHSTTKYIGGHSDVQGGALVFAKQGEQVSQIRQIRKLLGSVASPFSSWLILRGLRTLAARMRIHSANARAIASFLESHSQVAEVFYPGLPSNPGYLLASKQMSDFGGMLSFRVKGGRAQAIEIASRARLFINAGSLGGPESLIHHAVSFMKSPGLTPDDLLRLSVGLEHPSDLIDDLKQALG